MNRPHSSTLPTLSGLYAITDDKLMPANQFLAKAEAALKGGCRILQYRADKNAARHQRMQQATDLRSLCNQYQCTLLINDDITLAKLVGADGVHLGQGDAPLDEARKMLGQKAIIGITCHDSLQLAQQAELGGADYVAFGRFFPSETKPEAPPAELNILRQARELLNIPIVAIGGITLQRAAHVIEHGAHMSAVIHDLFAQENIEQQANAYRNLFTQHSLM